MFLFHAAFARLGHPLISRARVANCYFTHLVNTPRAYPGGRSGLAQSVAFILCVSCGVAGCRSGSDDSAASAASAPAAKVVTAQRGDISQVLTLAGQFQPYQVVDVHPKVTGFMENINVDIGDRVHKGEMLAVLEVPELKAQLQQTVFEMQQSKEEIVRAQHEINRAEATHAALHAEYERLKQAATAQPGLIAQQELDDAQAKDLSSEAQVDAAKAAMAAAQATCEAVRRPTMSVSRRCRNYTNVTAPLDGCCDLALRRHRRADPGRDNLQRVRTCPLCGSRRAISCVFACRFRRTM